MQSTLAAKVQTDSNDQLLFLLEGHERIMNDLDRLVHIITERKIAQAEFNRKEQHKGHYYSEEAEILQQMTSIKAKARLNCFLTKFYRFLIGVGFLKHIEDNANDIEESWKIKYRGLLQKESGGHDTSCWALQIAFQAMTKGTTEYEKIQVGLRKPALIETFANLKSVEEIIFYAVYLACEVQALHGTGTSQILHYFRAELGVPEDVIEFHRGLFHLDSLLQQPARISAVQEPEGQRADNLKIPLSSFCNRVSDWSAVSDQVLQMIVATFHRRSNSLNELLLFLEVSALTSRSKSNLDFYMRIALSNPNSFLALLAVTSAIKSNFFSDAEKHHHMTAVVDGLIHNKKVRFL